MTNEETKLQHTEQSMALISHEPQHDERLGRTIFVGNVPLETKREKLAKVFKSCGPVESVRFRSVPVKNIKLPKKAAVLSGERLPERDSMNAYVVFQNEESVDLALSMNGILFQNKHLKIDRAESPSISVDCCIFVGNLPFNVENEELYQVFSEIGSIKYVRIIRDKATGFGKGFGYVCFDDSISVIAAMRMNGSIQVKGRYVRIFRCKNSERLKKATAKSNSAKKQQDKKKRRKNGLKGPAKKSKKRIQRKKMKKQRNNKT